MKSICASIPAVAVLMGLSALLLARPLQAQQSQSAQPKQKPIIVVVERTKAGLQYRVDSQPAKDLLHSLSVIERRRGPDCPVVALLYPRVPVEWIWGIEGIAAKAQLSNVRVFVVFPDTGKMSEVRLLPAVPYSTNPDINRDPLGIR